MTVIQQPHPTTGHAAQSVDSAVAQAVIQEARRLRQRRRRRLGLIIGVVALLVTTGSVLLFQAGRLPRMSTARQGEQTVGRLGSALPPEMVVWRGFNIDVISSTSGHLIRTLATGVGLFRGIPHPTVSPKGIVYFDQGVEPTPNVPVEQIASVPLRGGPVTVVADGHYPDVSPNGRFLAYVADTDFTNAPGSIVVRDLLTGETKGWGHARAGPDISQLSWSPDSKALSFTSAIPTPDKRTETLANRVIDTSAPSGSLDAARVIPLPRCPPPGLWAPHGTSRAMAWAGYLSTSEGIGVCQHVGLTWQSSTTTLSVIDVSSGRDVAQLPTLRSPLGTGNVFDGAEGTIQIDATGQHLAIGEVRSGADALYRWTIGSRATRMRTAPILVAQGAMSGTWVPTK